ncbi:plasmid recombination protein [Ruminococcus sp.]|uniref:plasmid recombination protein n=1 Tax=Ruminococcus sp. TaxID=41978 RepID=UPI00258A95F9|nr:plasmid recombination protein [Ruminococcus sp.]MCR5022082.1 plasmid recombination protein [Ruminococcus sp.]
MEKKSISMCQGKGSLSHNNREFFAKNIDMSRTENNIVFVKQGLGKTYHQLFNEAVDRYNAQQKRKDRRIDDYFQHLFDRKPGKSVITGTNKQKSFYEDLVQIGTMDDTGVGSADAEITKECLREYMEGFQERNKNFHVFNAVMHLDEATPHLHIDYIPVGHFDRGLDTRNAMAKALEEMGHGKGKNAIDRWRLSEWEVLHQICSAHGIEISEPKKSRGYSFTVEEFGEYKDKIKALKAEKARAIKERDEARAELEKVSAKRVKLNEIESIEARESMFGKKVTLTKEDYDKLSDTAMKYVSMEKNIKNLKKERDAAVQELCAVMQKYEAVSSELSDYKKKESDKRFFKRENIKVETQRISDREKLQKAMSFISECGLSEDFGKYRYNRARSSELE